MACVYGSVLVIYLNWIILQIIIMVESKEELKSLLMRAVGGEWKSGLKLSSQKTKIMASSPITSWQIEGGKVETVTDFLLLISKIIANGDCSHEIEKTLSLWKKSYDKPRQHIKKQRPHFADKGPHSQSYGFFSSHVWMWELDHKEGWAPKNWCFQTTVLEKALESPSHCKVIKFVNPKGNQPWIFIGRIDVEAETPILWPPDVKSQLIGKDPDAGKDWRQKKRAAETSSSIQWTRSWVNSRRWWGTVRLGVL